MSDVEKKQTATLTKAPWVLEIAKWLGLISLLTCVACLIAGSTIGFYGGFLGMLSAGILGGGNPDKLRSATNKKAELYREVILADGLRLELYRSDGSWLAPKLFKDIGCYGKYVWYDSCRKWEIGLAPHQWAEVVKCISENDRREVGRETYYTVGDWVFIYDDWTFSIRREEWNKLVQVLYKEGVFCT
jgi:hypothetical protein